MILDGESLLYIPSTNELLNLEPFNRYTGAGESAIPGGDLIDEINIDK